MTVSSLVKDEKRSSKMADMTMLDARRSNYYCSCHRYCYITYAIRERCTFSREGKRDVRMVVEIRESRNIK